MYQVIFKERAAHLGGITFHSLLVIRCKIRSLLKFTKKSQLNLAMDNKI